MKIKYANGMILKRIKATKTTIFSCPYIVFENEKKQLEYYEAKFIMNSEDYREIARILKENRGKNTGAYAHFLHRELADYFETKGQFNKEEFLKEFETTTNHQDRKKEEIQKLKFEGIKVIEEEKR